jgi:4-hydroxy-tetrahydrodipicolinate synthase
MTKLEGVIGALLTPFDGGGGVDRSRLGRLYDFLTSHCDGISVLGPEVSEYAVLTPRVRRELLTEAVGALKDRTTVIAGVSAPTTAEVLELAGIAADAGAHYAQVLLPTRPYGGPPSPRETLAFVTEVAEGSPLPIVLYHHPGRGADPAFGTLVEACQVPNVAAIKDSSRDISRNLRAVEEIQKAGHAQYLATIQPMLAVMLSGGAGVMTPAGLTVVGAAIRDAVRVGDLARAGRMQSLVGRFPAAWGTFGLLPLAKVALELLGVPVGAPAAPYERPPEAVLVQIRDVIADWERQLPTYPGGGH